MDSEALVVVVLLELLEALGVSVTLEDGMLATFDLNDVLTSEAWAVMRQHAHGVLEQVEARALAVQAAEQLLEEARR